MRSRGYQRAFERGGTLRTQAKRRSLIGSIIVTLLWIFGISAVQAEPCSGTQGNIAVSPTSLDFGTVNMGSSKSLTLTVSNTGCANLSVGTLSMKSSVFKLSHNCPTILTGGGSCALNFTFTPTVAATVTNTYTLSTSVNSVTVPLKGVGAVATSTGTDTTTPPVVTDPPLILPTQQLGSGNTTSSFNSSQKQLRFVAPKVQATTSLGGVRGFAFQQPPGLSSSATPEQAARHFLANNSDLSRSFGINSKTTQLQLAKEKVASRGRSVVRFQEAYQGVPVLGGEVVVQMDAAKNVMSIGGEISNVGEQQLNTTPSFYHCNPSW